MSIDAIDRALGRLGQSPQPLESSLLPEDRDHLLEKSRCFPDLPLPTGELANWAAVLVELDKTPVVMAGVAAVEAALAVTPPDRSDVSYVTAVLAELHLWLKSAKNLSDLRRLGDLWWSLTRNPPATANTPLADAAGMAWLVAGYDPEGWGNPPDDVMRLGDWSAEAAHNVGYIVDVFSYAQHAVDVQQRDLIVRNVREAIRLWRDGEAAHA